MSSTALMSVSEYLSTSYRPDCEYLEGHLAERNVGERDHSWMLGELLVLLASHRYSLNLFTFLAQRVQVKPTRFRVPDISVTRGFPKEHIFTTPPFLCVEVLSRGDSLASMQDRIADYLAFGVENIWLVDPTGRKAWRADDTGVHEVLDAILATRDRAITLDLAALSTE